MNVSADVASFLGQFGWSPGRVVDITPITASYGKYARSLPPSYLELLRNVYGLRVELEDKNIDTELIRFDPLLCHPPSRAMARLCKTLFPVAEVDNLAYLYATKELHFWCDFYSPVFLGTSFDEAMRSLLWGSQGGHLKVPPL